MISRLKAWFSKPVPAPVVQPEKPKSIFTTDFSFGADQVARVTERLENMVNASLDPYNKESHKFRHAMDSGAGGGGALPIKSAFINNGYNIPSQQINWYSSQGFIGWQMAAIFAQHWLVAKACMMPARDAVRNGYEITINDGTEVSDEVLDALRKTDVAYKLNQNLIELVYMGRIFGIRIAIFIIESDDPDYYYKPFNPDGITPGSYKGISQIDPYWMTPQLDSESAGNPASPYFYVPTWWSISGKLYHRTHLIIYKTEDLADILKPTYIYGGIPVPQKIYERVYAAERVANEAPLLALTKRTDVVKCDVAQFLANEEKSSERLNLWVQNRDNYGIKTIDKESEDMMQFDTSLTDLDAVIMTQYQLVAAAANVPSVKLIGTSPKGFNATGEYEEASYHEELESIQTHDLSPLLERHHLLVIRSEIAPKFNIKPFSTTVTWNSLDAMTAKEQAELNKIKADTAQVLSGVGAIDGMDERKRIINDPESGYTGLESDAPEIQAQREDETEML